MQQDVLRDFHRQLAGGHRRFSDDLFDQLHELELAELFTGDVDADPADVDASITPGKELAAGLTEDVFTDGDDQSGIFGEFDEGRRAQQAALRMLPAYQRLDRADVSGAQVNLGLVVQDQLIAFYCLFQKLILVFLKREIRFFLKTFLRMLKFGYGILEMSSQVKRNTLVILIQPRGLIW